MSKEQQEYSSLVAFTDQELQKQNNDIDIVLASREREVKNNLFSGIIEQFRRVSSIHKPFYRKFIIERILTSRRLAKPYVFFDKLPYRSSIFDKFPLKGEENPQAKTDIMVELKDKSVEEIKNFIDTIRFDFITHYLSGIWYCERFINKGDNSVLSAYHSFIRRLNYYISKHNAAIELAEKKAGVSTPPPKPVAPAPPRTVAPAPPRTVAPAPPKPVAPAPPRTVAPTPPRPVAPAPAKPVAPAPAKPVQQIPQVPKNNDEKKGDNSTLYIIAGGALLLGIIYFVRKKP